MRARHALVVTCAAASVVFAGCVGPDVPVVRGCPDVYFGAIGFGVSDSDRDGLNDSVSLSVALAAAGGGGPFTAWLNASLEDPDGREVAATESGPRVVSRPNQGDTWFWDATLSNSDPAGNYTAAVWLSAGGQERCASQSDEGTLFPLATYGVRFAPTHLNATIAQGEFAIYQMNLTNTGTGASGYQLRITSVQGWSATWAEGSRVLLGAGESAPMSLKVQPWASVGPGSNETTWITATAERDSNQTAVIEMETRVEG